MKTSIYKSAHQQISTLAHQLIITLAHLLITTSIFAQAPQKMSYQAVVRDASGVLVANKAVGMQISILQGSSSGTAVYIERQFPTTNANGLVSLEIGTGTVVSGLFKNIDWANGTYFIKTETDLNGGANYTIAGTSQLLSVPYALHAKTAETVDYLQITGTPTIPKGATYRWATFSTYEQGIGWAFGNSSALFGGVNPSVWTDGNGIASNMSPDKEVLRTLFTQKGYATKNAMIMNNDWMSFSSTNGKLVMALFRVKNTTGSNINWSPSFYYSAYSLWNENASVALNGTSVMNATSSGSTTLTLTIPANRVSTVIFVSTSGLPSNGMRNCRLAFYNDSLLLPAGLEFVDDLDSATGGWEQ